MEAHNILSKRGFSVRSFGTGTHVKLPGPAPDKPNVYDFKTTYDQMYSDLLRKDKELYTQNGILHMLDRNKRIKPRPERFQNCKDVFDLILTCEERVYDQVIEDLNSREQETCQPVHVINVDIQDNHEEATLGAFLICELCQCIQHTEDMENEIDELLQEFEEKSAGSDAVGAASLPARAWVACWKAGLARLLALTRRRRRRRRCSPPDGAAARRDAQPAVRVRLGASPGSPRAPA
ncbi:ssu72 [Crotalus adamanteus]|uniref:RNA polymerase II subunit A C-terminal domain phosphatase SSU72 n=1 Tax=Crotalus adamanteus TaxID=8729 RepID=A0AAW1AR49_CROAD